MQAIWAIVIQMMDLFAALAAVSLGLWQVSSARARGPALKASTFALVASGLWALTLIADVSGELIGAVMLSLSHLAWLWFLYRLFSVDAEGQQLGPIRFVVAALALVELLQIALALAVLAYAGTQVAETMFLRIVVSFRLLFCIGALVLVHNLYVGAAQQARQSLRWAASAMALMWLYDLNFYTIAYLTGGQPHLLSEMRGTVLLASVVLLALGTLRNENDLQFRPSRTFAFQSFALLIIGLYLAVMVVVAQAIVFAGSEYAMLLQAAFVLVAGVLAVVLVPSRKLRGWLRVKVSKHLFQHRYDYRSEWLRFNDTIGRAGPDAPPLPERIVQAVADITDSPAGLLLTPHEEGGMELAARWRWPTIAVPGVALATASAAFFAQSQFILDLDDIRQGNGAGIPEAASPQWLLEDDRAWALVPLLHYERLMGVVVLARGPVNRRLDWEDFDLLRVVGRQLASYLAEGASQTALSEAQQFDEFNRRIAFVMHDIKNLASQLSLLARNAEKHADKAEFRADMILTLRNSTDKLQALLARLSRYGGQGGASCIATQLDALLSRVVAPYAGKHQIVTSQLEPCVAECDTEGLEQALAHLVQNAVEASSDNAPVIVSLCRNRGNAVIEVVDSGCGMSAEFIRTKLFKPFHSTKSGGFGIGAFEARELVRAMGGRLDVESREGLGTRFAITLPESEAANLARKLADDRGSQPINKVA